MDCCRGINQEIQKETISQEITQTAVQMTKIYKAPQYINQLTDIHIHYATVHDYSSYADANKANGSYFISTIYNRYKAYLQRSVSLEKISISVLLYISTLWLIQYALIIHSFITFCDSSSTISFTFLFKPTFHS